MDTNRIEKTDISVHNSKNAAFAMCKVSFLLIVITLLSDIVGITVFSLVERFQTEIGFFISKLLMFFGAEKGSAYASARLVISSEAFSDVIGLVRTFVTLVLPATVFAKLEKVGSDESFNVGGKCIKSFIPMFCLCHLLTTFASVFSGAISSFMLPDTAVYEAAGVTAHEFNIYEFIISILCTSIFVPIVEEYVFRGVIFSYLRRYGLAFGVVASAVVFGAAHSSPTQSVYAFVFGIVSALIMAVTGNIKTSILFHAGNNFITVVLGYLMGETQPQAFNIISSVYMVVVSAIGIYGIYALCRENGIMQNFRQKAKGEDSMLSVKPGMKQIFVLPFAVYLLYYVWNVLLTVM